MKFRNILRKVGEKKMIHEFIIKVDDDKKDIVGGMPLIDKPQELVRCKDCKWWDKKDDLYGYCNACKHGYHSSNWEIGIYRTYKGDWFCADGEMKE